MILRHLKLSVRRLSVLTGSSVPIDPINASTAPSTSSPSNIPCSSSAPKATSALIGSIGRGRKLIKKMKQSDPIHKVRSEMQSLLTKMCSVDTEISSESMRSLLKMAVDAGDGQVFSKMLEALSDDQLSAIDGDQKMLQYCIVKLAEYDSNAARYLPEALARMHSYDAFLVELALGRVVEESDEQGLAAMLQLIGDRKWPFFIDQSWKEQFIRQVYLPCRLFGQVEAMLMESADWSFECYHDWMACLVSPDPTDPVTPVWSNLLKGVDKVKRSGCLSEALAHLFTIHHPPDHILQKLAFK